MPQVMVGEEIVKQIFSLRREETRWLISAIDMMEQGDPRGFRIWLEPETDLEWFAYIFPAGPNFDFVCTCRHYDVDTIYIVDMKSRS